MEQNLIWHLSNFDNLEEALESYHGLTYHLHKHPLTWSYLWVRELFANRKWAAGGMMDSGGNFRVLLATAR